MFQRAARLVVLMLSTSLASAQPPVTFQQAQALFERGDLRAAQQAFAQLAQQAPSSRVDYGQAVVLYRLGRYAEAEALFRSLSADAEFGRLAQFNLGLIALQRQQPSLATRQFRQLLEQAPESQEGRMARAALRRLQRDGGLADAGRWLTSVYSMRIGLQDRYLDRSRDDIAATGQGRFAEGDVVLATDGRHWAADGVVFVQQGLDTGLPGFLYASSSVSRSLGASDAGVETRLSLSGDASWIDAAPFQNGLGLEWQRRSASRRYAVHLHYLDSPASRFDALQGWQVRLDGRVEHRQTPWRRRLDLRLEGNARGDDLRPDGDVTSYSPWRLQLEGRITRAAGPWQLQARLQGRLNHYPRSFVVDGVATTRNDQRLYLEFTARRRIRPDLSGLVIGRYVWRDSSLVSYRYQQTTAMLGLEWLP